MKRIVPAHINSIIALLLFSGILFAGAWVEPSSAPPQGDIPTARGGALHKGETFQKKEYGSVPAWGYAGGCPGENAAHPNALGVVSVEPDCDFSRFRPNPPPIPQDSGSIAVRNIYLRNAAAPTGARTGRTDKFADNIYLDAARRGAFHVRWIGEQLADHVVTATGVSEAVAECRQPTNSRYTLKLAGCSGSVVNFTNPQQLTAYCGDPEDCGFKGAYPGVGNSSNFRYTDVDPTSCKAVADNDGPSRVVAQAFCVVTFVASVP